ncbi:Peptidase S10 serine carboxypeptidase [Trinorchestia longiramus]|nr:Peptidase S10 serine carboxypeptidase [Trinorchestia longiramus]
MKLSAVLVVAVMVVSCAYGQDTPEAEADFIESLPGQDPSATYRQYSGYFDVGDGNMLHYWFIESQNEPATDPLLLWMNGGPGCSSLDGLLTELGPFKVNDDAQTLTENPYTWNTFANIVYLESPACVGFSYNEENGCSASDDTTAQHNYVALQQFFQRFPSYRSSPFFVTGESYGGIYVPTLSVLIVRNNDTYPINFQGFAVGNGLSSYDMNDNSLVFFANYHGLVSQDLWDSVVADCCGGVASQSTCNFASDHSVQCGIEVNNIYNAVYNGGLNPYSLYGDCQTAGSAADASLTPIAASKRNMFRKNPFVSLNVHKTSHELKAFQCATKAHNLILELSRSREVKSDPPCLDYTTETIYLNSAEVRAALHIPDTVREWTICSDLVSLLYTRVYDDLREQYVELAAAGVRGLVFNGDWDMACNFIGDQWFVDSLGFPLVEDHREWYSGDQVGGFVKRYQFLDFMTVRGSGHMVPEDKPAVALKMIRAFVFNQEYPVSA